MNNPIISWRSSSKKYQFLNKVGQIVSFTKIHTATTDFSRNVPYYVGVINFGKNIKTIGQIVNESRKEIKIGQKVIGIIRLGKKVEPNEVVEYLIKFKTQ
ncbi:MAG TPA: OB-fold domain-containing protein [Candidatus Woesebacteria bacterium]|nr:OB-fold domain-containing protein [Candidatus Shapirobacteria bacterium]HNY04346.1 OB-fold domain-containing protein [Candidatus Woesebacteria bacterium]HPR99392.1 OB-fold domain-containing protein [Candidatus Woesebacteria bacterium]